MALGFILQPILEWFVMYFFDEEAVKTWLAKSVLICPGILSVCLDLCIYIKYNI